VAARRSPVAASNGGDRATAPQLFLNANQQRTLHGGPSVAARRTPSPPWPPAPTAPYYIAIVDRHLDPQRAQVNERDRGLLALAPLTQREKAALLAVRYGLVHTDDRPEAGG
jgi:hypothetical protein